MVFLPRVPDQGASLLHVINSDEINIFPQTRGFSWTRFLSFSLNIAVLPVPIWPKGLALHPHLFLAQLGSLLCQAPWSHQSFAFRVISKKNSLCSPSPRRPRLLFLRYFLKPLSFQLCQGPRKFHSTLTTFSLTSKEPYILSQPLLIQTVGKDGLILSVPFQILH